MSVSTETDVVETGRSRRRELLVVALLVALLLVVAGVGWSLVHRPAPWPWGGPSDGDVLVQDVFVSRDDSSYTVESVRAVTRGDHSYLRVKLVWPDGEFDASSQSVPVLSGTVTHREPYAGVVATCGADGTAEGPKPGSGIVWVELGCQGPLFPEDVATVELQD